VTTVAHLKQRRREAALLLVATLAAYANAFHGTFQFDDFFVIVKEPAVQSLSAWWASMPGMRPLLKLSYALNHATGLGLAGFHALNLAIHAACVLLAWRLLQQWLPAAGYDPARSDAAALIAALVFALHPAQTEAVTYLSGRSMSLMALFSLAALLLGLRSARAGDRWMLASLLCLAAALAARETAWATVPALALLAASRGERGAALAARLAPPLVLLGLGALLLLALPVYRETLAAALARHAPAALLATQVDAVSYLLTRPLLLLEVNIDPDLPARAALGLPGALRAALLLAVLGLAAWQWRARPWLAVGLLWPFVMLAPGYSLFARADIANDRHLYLALLGPALLVGAALAALPRPAGRLATLALCAVLALVTVGRNTDYHSEAALWRATAAYSPGKARVWNNLGFALLNEGDLPGARSAFLRALALDPGHLKAHHNLAELESRAATDASVAGGGSAGR